MELINTKEQTSIITIFFCVSWFFVNIFLFTPNSVQAGSYTDYVREACPKEFSKYEDSQNYAIRMKPFVEQYGCGVVSAYGVFMYSQIDRIDFWEENPEIFEPVNRVFLMAAKHGLDIQKTPPIFDALFSLTSSDDELLTTKLDELLTVITHRQRSAINKEPIRILYLSWAGMLYPEKTNIEIVKASQELSVSIPADFLTVALVLEQQIKLVYTNYSASKRLNLIKGLMGDYKVEFLNRIARNKLALPNAIYLLPPQVEDIANVQNLSERQLYKLQREYIASIKQVIEKFEQKTGSIGLAMEGMSVLSPYILEALSKSPTEAPYITEYLKAQIESPIFAEYFVQQQSCGEEGFSRLVSLFFRFLAPSTEKNGKIEPVYLLQNNLSRISSWFHSDEAMRGWVVSHNGNAETYIQTMAWLPYFYEQSSIKSKKYVSKLISDLSGFYGEKTAKDGASFIVELFSKTDYFNWLDKNVELDNKINSNDDVSDLYAISPRYLYLLITPHPERVGNSVFFRYLESGQLSAAEVHQLQSYSVDELETHAFTTLDKWEDFEAAADWVIIGVSIAAVPLTGGTSLLMTSARLAAKKAVQYGIKRGVKVGYRYLRKRTRKNLGRTYSRLSGKKGGEAFKREAKEIAGIAPKRGRPSLYSKQQKKMISTIKEEKVENVIGMLYIARTSLMEGRCEESSTEVDICKVFKKGNQKNEY